MEDKLVKLHPKEYELIQLIRTQFRYGKIEIMLKDGLPYQILKTVESKLITGVDTIGTEQ